MRSQRCQRLGAVVHATLTGDDACPPHGVLEISEAVAVEAMLFDRGIEALFGNDKTRTDGQGRAHGQHESYVSGLRVSGRRWARARCGRITYLSSTMMPPCRGLCDQSRAVRGLRGEAREGTRVAVRAQRREMWEAACVRALDVRERLRNRPGQAWRGVARPRCGWAIDRLGVVSWPVSSLLPEQRQQSASAAATEVHCWLCAGLDAMQTRSEDIVQEALRVSQRPDRQVIFVQEVLPVSPRPSERRMSCLAASWCFETSGPNDDERS